MLNPRILTRKLVLNIVVVHCVLANAQRDRQDIQDNQKDVATAIKRVVILSDAEQDGRFHHGVVEVENALRARGIAVSEGAAKVDDADFVLLAGVVDAHGLAASTISEINESAPTGAESLTIRTDLIFHRKPAIVLLGADSSGLMYAALDIAERVGWTTIGENPFRFVRSTNEKPYLKDRGVAIFTMNRAYFENRLHDENFWRRYFDMFARDRINELVLTFGYEDGGYMAPPYPYFFSVDSFPDIKVVGLTPEQQNENFTSFRTMLRLASDRGIRVKPGIWEHIYRGGGQRGRIPWASDGTRPTPGLVWGLNEKNLVPYTVAALKKFYEVFPEIKTTQFRMHNESGLLDSEIVGFWHDIFGFYSRDERNIALELRAKGLSKSVIRDAQAQGLDIHLDTKIWMEQMGLPYHPTHINKEDQNNARQSYADLLEYPKTYNMNWTLWNGGTQRLLKWSDPEYVRRMAVNARLYEGSGLVVTEMEATKMLGDAPDIVPYDFLNAKYRYYDYEFERYWAFYRVWGRLSYDPAASSVTWERGYTERFGPKIGPHIMRALEKSSQVLPRIIATSVPYSIFPTSTGWPEMTHLGSLPQFAQDEEGSDIAQFMNVRDEAASIIQHTDTALRRPEETSEWFARTSDAILSEVTAAEKELGGRPAINEFKATLADAKIIAALARYHSWRQLAGVDYSLYKQSGSLAAFDDAIINERKAIQSWREIVEAASDIYVENMGFGSSARGFPRHWKDELPIMDEEFRELLSERRAAAVSENAKTILIPEKNLQHEVPVVVFTTTPGQKALPGKDFLIKVRLQRSDGIKTIRLRYRHLNQKEDYLVVGMRESHQVGLYLASIPGDFITRQWDLIYYVEVVDRHGAGRIYPDLERETPYRILHVDR